MNENIILMTWCSKKFGIFFSKMPFGKKIIL